MHTNIEKSDNADIIELKVTHFDRMACDEAQNRIDTCIANLRNVIVRMKTVTSIDVECLDWFVQTYKNLTGSYKLSFVLCEVDANSNLQQHYDDLIITPTLAEAIEVVNMEVIERELLEGDWEDDI